MREDPRPDAIYRLDFSRHTPKAGNIAPLAGGLTEMPWCSTASLRLCGQVRDSSSRSSDTTPRSFVFRAHRYTAQRRQSRRRGAQEACSRFQGRSLPRLRVAEHDGAEEAKERLPTAVS